MKRPPRTHHCSPGHRPTVSRLARVVSIRKRNQMKPFYCPPLKCNPETAGPYCIPQNTKCRFPVDHLRRATAPCYGPHGIYDIRPAKQCNPQQRSDQISENTTDSLIIDIKFLKVASRRQRNASSPFHIKLLSQLFRVRLL